MCGSSAKCCRFIGGSECTSTCEYFNGNALPGAGLLRKVLFFSYQEITGQFFPPFFNHRQIQSQLIYLSSFPITKEVRRILCKRKTPVSETTPHGRNPA